MNTFQKIHEVVSVIPRGKVAAETLVSLGYTNIKEFGGIIDRPYEVVK